MKEYIDFQIAPYALPTACEALYRNGITNGCITLEDGDLHIRWEFNPNRKYNKKDTSSNTNSNYKFYEDILRKGPEKD